MPNLSTRFSGVSEGLAVKKAVRVATTANLATLAGLLTIDGITVADGDRVLVKNQTSAIANGIYTASTGAWSRAIDFDGNNDICRGTRVLVNEGLLNTLKEYVLVSPDPIAIDEDDIDFDEPASSGTSGSGNATTLAVPGTYATLQAAVDALESRSFIEEGTAIEVTGHVSTSATALATLTNPLMTRVTLRGATDPLTKSIATTGHSIAIIASSAVGRFRSGSGYTPGTYTDLPIVGGTYTSPATIDVIIDETGRVSSEAGGVVLRDPGEYSVAPGWPLTVTGLPGGSDATFEIQWQTTVTMALANTTSITAGDMVNVDNPRYETRWLRWGLSAVTDSFIGRLTISGTSAVLTAQLDPGVLEVGDLLFVNGETRYITAIADNTHFTIDSAFTSTVSEDETDPDAETTVGAVYWHHLRQQTGTVSTSGRSTTVTGVGTFFTGYSVGDFLCADGTVVRIATITSDTSLTTEQAVNWSAGTRFGIHAQTQTWLGSFKITSVDHDASTITFVNTVGNGVARLTSTGINGGTVTILRDVLTNTSGSGIYAKKASFGLIEKIGLAGPGTTVGTGIGNAIFFTGDNHAVSIVVGSNVGITDFGVCLFNHMGSIHADYVVAGNIRAPIGMINYQGEMYLFGAKISSAGTINFIGGPGSSTYHSYAVLVGGEICYYRTAGAQSYADGCAYVGARVTGTQSISNGGGHDTEGWAWGCGVFGMGLGAGTSVRAAGFRAIACGHTGIYCAPGSGFEGAYSWATGGGFGFLMGSEAQLTGCQAIGNANDGLRGQDRARVGANRFVARKNGGCGIRAFEASIIDASTSYSLDNVLFDYLQSGNGSEIIITNILAPSLSTKSGAIGTVQGWIQGEASTPVASAATCDIGSGYHGRVTISGTTTITSFGTTANRLVFVLFSGALTLTHNATSLILPGGANITTVAGDTCICTSDASGNWRVRAFSRSTGTTAGTNSYSTSIGDGAASSFAVTHSLGTREVLVDVYENATYFRPVVGITRTSTTVVTIDFGANVPTASQFRVVVQKLV